MRPSELHAGGSLPLRIDDRQRLAGAVIFVFGTAFIAMPAFFWFLMLSGAEFTGNASPEMVAIFLTTFAGIGVAICLWGVHRILYRLRITVDRQGVRGERRGLRGTRTWTAPLRQYRGVLGKTETRGGGGTGSDRSPTYTVYLVLLKHFRDEALDVPLVRSLNPVNPRVESERFARLLDLPALTETADGVYEARAAEDLDKSVAELAAEGKLEVPDAPTGPLRTKNVRQLEHAGGYAFEQSFRTAAVVLGAIFLAIGAGLLVLHFGLGGAEYLRRHGWQVTGNESLLALVGFVCAAAGAAFAGLGPLARMTLEVDPSGVRHAWTIAGTPLRETWIPASEVEEVTAVAKAGVFVKSDEGRIWFGPALSEHVLEHVRAAVLATLAQGRDPDAATPAGPAPETPEPAPDPRTTERIERLREFATASLGAGRTPEQVFAKLTDLGAPVVDASACMRAIAADPGSPHARSVRGFLEARAPGSTRSAVPAATAGGIAGAAPARARGKRARGDGKARGVRFERVTTKVLRYAVPVGLIAWFTSDLWMPLLPGAAERARAEAERRAAPAREKEKALAAMVEQRFAGFDIVPSKGAGYVLVGGRGLRAEAHGEDLRIAFDRIRLEKLPQAGDVRYESLGIDVDPTDTRRRDEARAVWDREVRGALSAQSPAATIDGHVFVVRGMADACRAPCKARLLLSVKVPGMATYAENTPFAPFRTQQTRTIAAPAATPSRYWDTYYDRALASKSAKRYAEAESRFRETLDFIAEKRGPGHPAIARTLVTFAHMQKERGKPEEFEKHMLRALGVLEQRSDAEVKSMLADARLRVDAEMVARNLGEFYWDRRDYARGFEYYERAHEAAPGLATTEYSRNLKLAHSAAGMMVTACKLGDFDIADAAMAELERRIEDVEPASQKKLRYWIRTGKPRLAKRRC